MEANSILTYIQSHGYIVLFLSLFFGIVGIPAPEESLLFFVGIFISHDQLHFLKSLFFAISGATIGMVAAYTAGYTFGSPLLFKYGHYIGCHLPLKFVYLFSFSFSEQVQCVHASEYPLQ